MILGFVLDASALAALGAGNRTLSRLVVVAHARPDRHVYVPALCLAAATAERPLIAEHVGHLPQLEVAELDYPAASAAGQLISEGHDWRIAHAIVLGRPTPDWQHGRPVITANPAAYAGTGAAVVPLN
ncbi:hypothetical protein [Longispora albida]|uniref:hypothetical protein n=1 Tax=Longispora albida TaxID=203523 RepID=UPI000381A873|nr:hypothetical protein [Longispora albida]